MFHWGLLLEASGDIKATRLIQDIRWGIGKREVEQMFSGKLRLPVEPGWNEIGFVSPSHGMPASFFFYFLTGIFGGDKLSRIQIMYLTPADSWLPDDEIENAFRSVRDDLLAHYGEPNRVVDGRSVPVDFRQSEELLWKLPDSILTLSYGLIRDGFHQVLLLRSLSVMAIENAIPFQYDLPQLDWRDQPKLVPNGTWFDNSKCLHPPKTTTPTRKSLVVTEVGEADRPSRYPPLDHLIPPTGGSTANQGDRMT